MKAIIVQSAVTLWRSVVPGWYARRFYQEFRLDGELLTCGRVDLPVSVQHDLEAEQKAFGFYNFSGFGAIGQRDCLVNGHKRATDYAMQFLTWFPLS